MRRGFRPGAVRVYRLGPAVDDEIVDPVLNKTVRVRRSPQSLGVAFVFREEKRLCALAGKLVIAERVVRSEQARALRLSMNAQVRLAIISPPAPGIPKPERREEMRGAHFPGRDSRRGPG